MLKFKYLFAFIIPSLGLLTFHSSGIFSYFGLFFLYLLVPLIEQIIPPNIYNLNKIEKEFSQKDLFFDFVLYLSVFVHVYIVYDYLLTMSDITLTLTDMIANVLMMGTILGVNGINIGHELGHKTEHKIKTFFAHVMLLTAIQNHFIPYHNGGHHRDVATPKDLTSAKEGDIFYFFAIRSQIGGYFKTWKLEHQRLKAKNKNIYLNQMTLFTLLPILMFFTIYTFFGLKIVLIYFITSILGISVLEAQNYFSHYGLRRKLQENGRYERVKPKHSWNSDHIIGRVLLFELTRHSDHHQMGSKPYQLLESKLSSPTLPFGYPMMLLLSYFPFLFKPIMKKHLKLNNVI